MIIRYQTKISAMLRKSGCDEVSTIFDRETKDLQKNIDKEISDKCFNSAIFGALITVFIFAGVFYFISKSDKSDVIMSLYESTK